MFKAYLKKNRDGAALVLIKSWYFKPAKLPFVFSTGIKIDADDWDADNYRCKEGKKYPLAKSTNGLIHRYITEATIYVQERMALETRTPDHQEVKEHLQKVKDQIQGITTTAAGNKTDLIQYTYKVYEKLSQDKKRSDHYAKMFLTLARNLDDYKKANKRLSFAFHALGPEWFADWQNYCFGLGLSQNSVAGYWKRLKTVMIKAKESGLLTEEVWKGRTLAVNFQRADEVWLTPEELMKLYHLDLSTHYLETDRDLFLLDALNSGHRLSDMASIDQGNILEMQDAKIIKIHAHKTDTLVYSPNGWYLQEFLQKYKDGFPKMKVEQVFNRNVRECCRLAGIVKPTKLRKNKGGKNIYITKPKFEWVHQYTARYSFATNLSLAGVNIQDISRLMGHSNIKQTEGYIKSKQLHAAINAAQNPYFMEKPIKKTI